MGVFENVSLNISFKNKHLKYPVFLFPLLNSTVCLASCASEGAYPHAIHCFVGYWIIKFVIKVYKTPN